MTSRAACIPEHRHERVHMRHPVAKAVVVVMGGWRGGVLPVASGISR